MNDTELDELIAATARVSDADVARWDLTGPEHELCEAIMSTGPTSSAPETMEGIRSSPGDQLPLGDEPTPPEISLTRAAPGPRRRRPLVTALAATAAVALVVLGVWAVGGSRTSHYSVEPAEVAESAPRLLVDLPGWVVDTADEQSSDDGQMTLTDGARSLELHWYPVETYEGYRRDRLSSAAGVEPATLLGQQAEIFVPDFFDDAGLGDFRAQWRQGAVWVEAITDASTSDEVQELLDAVVEVDTAAWYEAMPAEVVTPPEAGLVIDAMLQGVPLPPGAGLADLDQVPLVRSRYQLGVAVITQVACGWIDAWVAATDSGDDQAAQQAVDAMATSHDWAILIEMDAEGDWPGVIWEYADAMATNAPIGPGGGFTIGESYRQGLGCDPNSPAGL